MTHFQNLTATQWRNRINEYNPGMYTKELLCGKTAKELAQIQNGNGGSRSKPMSAIRDKLEAIKKDKVFAIKKEKYASDSVQQLLAALSKPDKAPVRRPAKAKAPVRRPAKAKDETADLIKKLIGVLQSKAKVQERDTDSDDESDESEEE